MSHRPFPFPHPFTSPSSLTHPSASHTAIRSQPPSLLNRRSYTAGPASGDRNRSHAHARAVRSFICVVDAAVVLGSVLLDFLPHLLDGLVEALVRLFLLLDNGSVAGCAAVEGLAP